MTSVPGPADRPGRVWVDGRLLPADGAHLSVFDRGFQLGDGVFETLRVRASHPTELVEHVGRLRRSAEGLDIALPADLEARLATGIAELLAANGLDGPDGDASVRITISRGPYRGRGLLPAGEVVPATIAIQAWPVVPAAAASPGTWPPPDRLGGPTRPGQPARLAQDHLASRLRLRQARGAPGRCRRRALPHHRRPPVGGHDRQHLPRAGRSRTASASSPRHRSTARSCPGRPGRGCSAWAGRVGLRPVEGRLRAATWPAPRRRSCRRAWPASCRSRDSTAWRSGRAGPGRGPAGHGPIARR